MLKEDRYRLILDVISQKDVVKVSELAERLNVAEMTIRRDLNALEEQGLIERVHGGAKKKGTIPYVELSHVQKQTINVEEKKHIAQKCAELICDHDIVFIGPGTTNELIYDYVKAENVDVITNSITVFNRFKHDSRYDVILIGGRFRERTGTFIGYFANKLLSEIKVNKAFIGTNGIIDTRVTTANEEEGNGQRIILDNAAEKYILADHSKFGVEAFCTFYDVKNVTAIITDTKISPQIEDYYKKWTKIIK